MSALAAGCAATAVLAVGIGRAPGRGRAGLGRWPVPVPVPVPEPAPRTATGSAVAAGPRRRLRLRSRPAWSDPESRLAAVLVEVAAVVRAGADPGEAWSVALGTDVRTRVPTPSQLAMVCPGGGPGIPAAVVAAGLADERGAPLASVLEQVAAAVSARAEVAAEVGAALAGPRSSARVLAWLPVLGIVLGTVLGADPLGALLSGGAGTVSGAAGAVLMLAGRGWTGALLRRALRAGSEP